MVQAGVPCLESLIKPLMVQKIIPFGSLKLPDPEVMTFENIGKNNITSDDYNILWNHSLYNLNNLENPDNFSRKLADLSLAYVDLENRVILHQ